MTVPSKERPAGQAGKNLDFGIISIQVRFFIVMLVASITFDILQKLLTAGSTAIFLYLKVGLPAILCD